MPYTGDKGMVLDSVAPQMKVVLEPSGTYGDNQPADGKTPDIAKATLPVSVPQDASVLFSILTAGCVFVGTGGTIGDKGATFTKVAVNGVADDVEFTSSGATFVELSAQVIDRPVTQSTAEFFFTQVPAELDLQPPTATAVADASDVVVVTATVVDSQKKPIKDVQVTFSVTGGGTLSSGCGRTNGLGRATTNVTSGNAGTSTVTAQCPDVAPQNMIIQFTAVSHDPVHIGLTSEPPYALANSQDKIMVMATVYDAQNGVIPNANVTFSITSGTAVVSPTNVTAANGAAITYVTSGLIGTPQLKATSGNAAPSFISLDFRKPEVGSIQLDVNPNSATPGFHQPNVVFTVAVTDTSGVKLQAGTVAFSDNSDGALVDNLFDYNLINGSHSEINNGIAMQQGASFSLGNFAVIATCDGKSSLPTTVRFQHRLAINDAPSSLGVNYSGTVSGSYDGGPGKVLTVSTESGLSAPSTCTTITNGVFSFKVEGEDSGWTGSGSQSFVYVSDGISSVSQSIYIFK